MFAVPENFHPLSILTTVVDNFAIEAAPRRLDTYINTSFLGKPSLSSYLCRFALKHTCCWSITWSHQRTTPLLSRGSMVDRSMSLLLLPTQASCPSLAQIPERRSYQSRCGHPEGSVKPQ